jgi:hypothetical protein
MMDLCVTNFQEAFDDILLSRELSFATKIKTLSGPFNVLSLNDTHDEGNHCKVVTQLLTFQV